MDGETEAEGNKMSKPNIYIKNDKGRYEPY